jgi:hypothetical protein
MVEPDAGGAPASVPSPGYLARVRLGIGSGVGVGLVVGIAEVILLAVDLQQPLGFVGFATVGLLALLVNGALGAGAALVAGLVVHLEPPDPEAARRAAPLSTLVARQVAGAGLLLAGMYLWEAVARSASADASPAVVGAMAAAPFAWGGIVYFNARFWLRRAEAGTLAPVGFLPVAAAGGLAVVAIAAAVFAVRSPGGGAPDRAPSVVIITIDGLRVDQVSAGGTPALAALATEGVRFADAVTPTPESRAANATVLVGLHPLRHLVLTDGDRLSRSYRTVFEVLNERGWVTGAFVSGPAAAARSGLSQGFGTYDDLAGMEVVHVVGLAVELTRLVFDLDGPHREPGETAGRFASWVAQQDTPFAVWIHLDAPHLAAVHGTDPEAAVTAVDDAVGVIRAALAGRGEAPPVAFVVAGTHGELLGAHGGRANRTLYDEVVRVPLIVVLPGNPVDAPVVDAQVRLMDVPATVLDWLQLPPLDESEGLPLTGYVSGVRRATIWTALVGRDLSGGWLLGLRNNGVKYVRRPDGGEELYDLRTDPTETQDARVEQRSVVIQARSLLSSDAAALDAIDP